MFSQWWKFKEFLKETKNGKCMHRRNFVYWKGWFAGGAEELPCARHCMMRDEKFYVIGKPFLTWKKILIVQSHLDCKTSSALSKGWHQLSQWAGPREQIVAQAAPVPSVLPEKSCIHLTARDIKHQAVCSHPTGKTQAEPSLLLPLALSWWNESE